MFAFALVFERCRLPSLVLPVTKLAIPRPFDSGLCSRVEGAHPMPTPEELWKKLALDAGEDEIASAASADVSHAERDLRTAGFDVKAERERAHAWLADLAGETAPASDRAEPTAWVTGAPPSGRRSPANRRAVLIAAAIAALATGAGILYALGRRSTPHDLPIEVPPQAPSASAPAPSAPRQDMPKPAAPARQDKPNL